MYISWTISNQFAHRYIFGNSSEQIHEGSSIYKDPINDISKLETALHKLSRGIKPRPVVVLCSTSVLDVEF